MTTTTAADGHPCIDCANDPTGRGICETHLARAEARQQDASALRLADDLVDYIDALMGADLSYTELPEDDPRRAKVAWPIEDSRTTVADVIECDTWEDELATLRERRTVLAALPPSAPPALDVERLATAIATEDGPGAAWCRNDLTSTEFAERIAAEYARLAQDRSPEPTDD